MKKYIIAKMLNNSGIGKWVFSLVVLLIVSSLAHAQQDRNTTLIRSALNGFEYELKCGINIGGTSPIPLPAEIRAIKGYSPRLALSIEGNMLKWFDPHWGMIVGLRLENKGMTADARVKNYSMEMTEKDGGFVKGMWTGDIHTKVNNSYLSMPVLGVYKLSPRVRLKGGLFVGYLLEGNFSGTANNGYLRNGDPTGNKMEIDEAFYDFSEHLRKISWGAQLGGDWRAFKHFNVSADLTWGFNDIFKRDFKTITFSMYPIFLNVGFGYAF